MPDMIKVVLIILKLRFRLSKPVYILICADFAYQASSEVLVSLGLAEEDIKRNVMRIRMSRSLSILQRIIADKRTL